MDGHTLRFTFEPVTDPEALEDDFGLAPFAASCIHGRAGIRLAARYVVSPDGRRCVATVAGSAGEAALRVFTGLCPARLGDDGFRIEHVGGATC